MSKAAAGPLFQSQAAHYRNEGRFRRLLERLPAGAYMCDAEGLITFYNQRAVDLWGRAPRLRDPADRWCGSVRLFAKDGSPVAHDRCWMARAIGEDRSFNGEEIVIERPDGRRLTVLAHASPVHDDQGRLVGAVNVLVDITERTQREQAMAASDRAKNRFIATVGHELRNPLAPIRNVIEILRMRGSDVGRDLPWALDVLERQVRHMSRLIDDLLDFGRASTNRLELHRERVDLADVLRTAAETSRPFVTEAGHELTFDAPPPLLLECDRMRLAQVVANLLHNAARYTPRGGRIWLTARRERDEAVISVRDNGVGIDPRVLPHLFDMFVDGGPPAQPAEREGLGIGLALARTLVERHGGSITACSAGPNQGSEFIVRLPAPPSAPVAVAPAPRPAALKLLIVDPSRTSSGNLRALLQLLGHRAREARDLAHAQHLAEALRPDVVLVDLATPPDNARTVDDWCRQIRGSCAMLVALCDREGDVDLVRMRASGFDAYLVRPVDAAALVTVLGALAQVPAASGPGVEGWRATGRTWVFPVPPGTH